ncbi:uncharacterized protein LOC117514141 [Thalassophryne amazonica]|uniref:uncharacterized protein LOC117514141 n=1 Tax=Thalassophryne amazonica TaxID=390379 RepID=UPI001471A7E1|nr:uncharacterized protein LOC117514141 [Thalassophryne amazonica]
MLCPAAAALCLLAALGSGLCLSQEDFALCSHCFYRQTPPQGTSEGLRPFCYTLPRGQVFATLYKSTCDGAVYSAFLLSHGWTERLGEEVDQPVTVAAEDNIKVAVPALLRGAVGQSHDEHWNPALQTSITSQCSSVKGDLYILTGNGRIDSSGDGGEECQLNLQWSAVCCAAPEGKESFSVGLIHEPRGDDRTVSIKELEEILGAAQMFFEDCRGTSGGLPVATVDLHSEALPGNVHSDSTGEEVASAVTDQQYDDDAATSRGASLPAEHGENNDAQPEEAQKASSAETEVRSESGSEAQQDVTHAGAERSEISESSEGDVETTETGTNSSSTLMYIISTTLSICKAPLRPVVSTITQLPGQVGYVLKEDLGVLSALPGETCSLLYLVTSDLLSWVWSAVDTLLGVWGTCVSSAFGCISSMLGELLTSCYAGVTGLGTLLGNTLGIFGDALDNAWWVTRFFGGRLWENSEGYMGSVVSEMGGQVKAVGGGVGRLLWRGGAGVINTVKHGGGFIIGTLEVFFGAMKEAFGQESE